MRWLLLAAGVFAAGVAVGIAVPYALLMKDYMKKGSPLG